MTNHKLKNDFLIHKTLINLSTNCNSHNAFNHVATTC